MSDQPGPLLLLDSASMYFRAFFALPDTMTAPDGTPVNAVRGFLDAISRLVEAHRPSRVVACWDDDWRPAFRVDAIPSYKEHRLSDDGGEEVPAALSAQVPVIVDVLAALGIPRLGSPGYEADDVIGTLVAREVAATDRASEVLVMTGDRDLFQLVDDDAGVVVLYPVRGQKEPQRIDEAWLREKYGVDGGQAYADMATLRGDPSDGLPGVAGIGEKTAASLLAQHGTLAGIIDAAQDHGSALTATQRKRILAAADYLAVAPTVVQVARDAPVAEDRGNLGDVPADGDTLLELAERWGLESPLKRLVDACAAVS
ncbi:5'-3' exonuclease [Georgenia satyanarayanai]|uniref:5'-3' exonuclease n=1 Tax=Georgenia satyanarayanai TaxID=860221 RepID=A0A2Y8ZWS3_9MICO|nr:5'-3' exonuclease [Georgenia satyanarayanai]PYG01968.1 5'-3' exonuclease [Georgenia satyanarayanai]SSA36771.1 5'-3' exonuclease [Georgenia satyanarayanai]